jgi:hypothetical protein
MYNRKIRSENPTTPHHYSLLVPIINYIMYLSDSHQEKRERGREPVLSYPIGIEYGFHNTFFMVQNINKI